MWLRNAKVWAASLLVNVGIRDSPPAPRGLTHRRTDPGERSTRGEGYKPSNVGAAPRGACDVQDGTSNGRGYGWETNSRPQPGRMTWTPSTPRGLEDAP